MAKGAAPSQDQLLDLLKRAAEELKHAQEEARTAVAALQKEQAAHRKTEDELDVARNKASGTSSQNDTDTQLLKDQIEAERENAKSLDTRVKELEAGLEGAIAERETLRAKVAESETAISVAQQQEAAKRAQMEEEQGQALDGLQEQHTAAMEKLKAEHAAQVEAMKTEHSTALEGVLAESARVLDAEKARAAEEEANAKAMVDDAAGKLVAMESQLTQEKEKHQLMAQKLLETRSKVRELEAGLSGEQERVKGLEVAASQMADSHDKALREAGEQHQRATAELTQTLAATQQELATVTERWRDVERSYEALHREMLLTLEQRDEARRALENERTERERLQRALGGQR